VNLMDEAIRKNIHINLPLLSQKLGVPVISTVARQKKSLDRFLKCLDDTIDTKEHHEHISITYPRLLEKAIAMIQPILEERLQGQLNTRWLSLKLLEQDPSLLVEIDHHLGTDFLKQEELISAINIAQELLQKHNIDTATIKDQIVSSLVHVAEDICQDVVTYEDAAYNQKDRKIDHILTSRWTGYPIMLALLAIIFWLTMTGANYPSQVLSDILFYIQDRLTDLFMYFHAPAWLHGVLVLGIYRVLAWVVSVMLPPMAIFFPLFTLLEDVGYLPRIAYNLDKPFKCCCACGKQALTMCMGFGCNAAGVIGCRIIDSPRERLLAIITNNFVPCNGRFPTLIAIITMFFVGSAGIFSSVLSALFLTGLILLGIIMTFLVTKCLSKTLLKGVPSSFTLELPPYRKPQIGKIIIRSLFDRTLFVLGRAVCVAIPAGLIIWLMANIIIGDMSLLNHCAQFLDPFAKLLGLDGVILIAFILGLPANEIVVPIIIMAYLAQGTILDMSNLVELKALLVQNGWTWITAISTMLFSLMHWPCSTTLMTIKKETGSWKWSIVSFLVPTLIGLLVCFLFAQTAYFFI
ncbi:MAG: ferrous iron transporter B, partial [Coprobacillus cateniformis]